MLSHEGSSRSFTENASLAVALSGVAGAVNATGFFVVGTYTSHVTGNLARVGDELAQGRIPVAREAFLLVLAFLAGAMTATAFVEVAKKLGRARYTGALLFELGTLLTFTGLSVVQAPLHLLLTAMLCFAMGLQNALVTKISGAVVRTTHLTGVTTDFGIELVRIFFWVREQARGLGLVGKARLLARLPGDPELQKAWLHFAIFASFFTGAVAGPLLYLRAGHLAMLLPCFALVTVIFADHARRLRAGRKAPAPAAAATSK